MMSFHVPPISDWKKAVDVCCFVALVLFLFCSCQVDSDKQPCLLLDHARPQTSPLGGSSNQENSSVANDFIPGLAWDRLRLESLSQGRS